MPERFMTLEITYVVDRSVAVQIVPVDATVSSCCPDFKAVFASAPIRLEIMPARKAHCNVTTGRYPNEMRFRFEISTTSPYGHYTIALPNHFCNEHMLLVSMYFLGILNISELRTLGDWFGLGFEQV